MSRISAEHVARAIAAVRALSMEQKAALGDDLFHQQPTLFGCVLVQTRFGVSFEKMGFLLELLFVCFLAMRESGHRWPPISEDEMDRQAARYSATVNFSEGLAPALAAQAQAQYLADHPERNLLAYVTTEAAQWLNHQVPAEENDKYVVLAAMNIVNCIAFTPTSRASR